MKRLFAIVTVCLIALFSVGCTQTTSVKDVSAPTIDPVVSDVDEVIVDSDPIVDEQQEGDFDPDAYEDKEIDDLLGLLEGLVEG